MGGRERVTQAIHEPGARTHQPARCGHAMDTVETRQIVDGEPIEQVLAEQGALVAGQQGDRSRERLLDEVGVLSSNEIELGVTTDRGEHVIHGELRGSLAPGARGHRTPMIEGGTGGDHVQPGFDIAYAGVVGDPRARGRRRRSVVAAHEQLDAHLLLDLGTLAGREQAGQRALHRPEVGSFEDLDRVALAGEDRCSQVQRPGAQLTEGVRIRATAGHARGDVREKAGRVHGDLGMRRHRGRDQRVEAGVEVLRGRRRGRQAGEVLVARRLCRRHSRSV